MSALAERIVPPSPTSVLLHGPVRCSPLFVGLETTADFARRGPVIVLLDRAEDRHSYHDHFDGWRVHRNATALNVSYVVRPRRPDLDSYLTALRTPFSGNPQHGLILNDVSRRMLPFTADDHFLKELAREIARHCAAPVLTVAATLGRVPLSIADTIFELRDGGNGRAHLQQVKPSGNTVTLIPKNTPTTMIFDVERVAHV